MLLFGLKPEKYIEDVQINESRTFTLGFFVLFLSAPSCKKYGSRLIAISSYKHEPQVFLQCLRGVLVEVKANDLLTHTALFFDMYCIVRSVELLAASIFFLKYNIAWKGHIAQEA